MAEDGKNAFRRFLNSLDTKTIARVLSVIARIRNGNLGDVKPVGEGVSERRIDTGPGYRIYFGRDGEKLVILLGGGTKQRQQKDINDAKASWAAYKAESRRRKSDAN